LKYLCFYYNFIINNTISLLFDINKYEIKYYHKINFWKIYNLNPIGLIFYKLMTEFKKFNHINLIDDIKQCLKKITNKDINKSF